MKIIIVVVGPLAALLLAIAGIASGDSPTLTCHSGSGDSNIILATIRTIESNNNYQAAAPRSSASGAYQFTDATWNNHAGYSRAVHAPANIQDQKALQHVTTILNQTNSDISLIGPIWYIGHQPIGAEWDTIPFPNAGNTLTPRQYQTKWLNTYNTLKTQADPTNDPDLETNQTQNRQADTQTDPHDHNNENDDNTTSSLNCAETTIIAIQAHGPAINVAASIAPQVQLLVTHARQDGHLLGGWGWRDHQRQHELRKINGCGRISNGRLVDDGSWTHSDNEDPTQWVPSSRCATPTARPGSSLHETGLAIDFTCAGRSFANTTCARWVFQAATLNPNTCKPSNTGTYYPDRINCYGLYNLPSEPWHFSTTGR